MSEQKKKWVEGNLKKRRNGISRDRCLKEAWLFWSLENSWTGNSNGEHSIGAIQLYFNLSFSEHIVDSTPSLPWSWTQPYDLLWSMEYKQKQCAFISKKKLLRDSVQFTMFPLFPWCDDQLHSSGSISLGSSEKTRSRALSRPLIYIQREWETISVGINYNHIRV